MILIKRLKGVPSNFMCQIGSRYDVIASVGSDNSDVRDLAFGLIIIWIDFAVRFESARGRLSASRYSADQTEESSASRDEDKPSYSGRPNCATCACDRSKSIVTRVHGVRS
jgi:hypothetical protein